MIDIILIMSFSIVSSKSESSFFVCSFISSPPEYIIAHYNVLVKSFSEKSFENSRLFSGKFFVVTIRMNDVD